MGREVGLGGTVLGSTAAGSSQIWSGVGVVWQGEYQQGGRVDHMLGRPP